MQLTSVGTQHHQGKRVPALVADLAESAPRLGEPDRMKLLLLRRGNGVLESGGASEVLVAPAVALVGNDVPARVSTSARASGLVLFFHPQYLNDELTFGALAQVETLSRTGREDRYLLRHFLDAGGVPRVLQLEALAAQQLAGFLEQLRDQLLLQPDPFWPCRSRSFFLQVLLILDQLLAAREAAAPGLAAAQVAPWSPGATADHDLRPVVAHLVAHCDEELTVDRLARTFATNRTTLQARFKRGTGMSVGQYVIHLRVHVAALLLRDTSLTVAEIMERTGFNDPSHFARTFRRHTGRSPSDFRALFRVPGYILA